MSDDNAGPLMVATWNQVKTTMQDEGIKEYIGKTTRF